MPVSRAALAGDASAPASPCVAAIPWQAATDASRSVVGISKGLGGAAAYTFPSYAAATITAAAANGRMPRVTRPTLKERLMTSSLRCKALVRLMRSPSPRHGADCEDLA